MKKEGTLPPQLAEMLEEMIREAQMEEEEEEEGEDDGVDGNSVRPRSRLSRLGEEGDVTNMKEARRI